MPPHTPLSTPFRAWTCPQCTKRAFSTTRPSRAVGPEHPQYLPVPEPPQTTIPYRPAVKGSLPVPRDVLAGAGGKKANEEWLADAAKRPLRPINHAAGSREEWKVKMADSRRRNLKEGVKSLKARQDYETRKMHERRERMNAEHLAALNAPEREDERLTTPTHGLDLETLLHKAPADPHRESRLATKRANHLHQTTLAHQQRLNNLHTLYTHAQHFIVTPQQLDAAVDEAFGTEEKPVKFAFEGGIGAWEGSQSVWGQGKPASVQDLLVQAGGGGRGAVQMRGSLEVSRERMRRLGEVFTGGSMEEG